MHLAVEADLGLGHLDLALEIVDLIAALQGLGFDAELHLLIVGHHVLLVDFHVIEIHAGAGEPLLRGHHLRRQRSHHLALGQPIKVAQLAGVRRLQFAVATAIVGKLGQRSIQGPLLGEQPQGIALIELGIVPLQLAQVAALLVELALKHRQIQLHQHLAARHRLTLLNEQIPHLAAGTSVEDAGVVGVDQHAHAFHLGGHGPEKGPQHQHTAHPRQAHAHLVVIAQPLPAGLQPLKRAAMPGLCGGGAGRSHGAQLAGFSGSCQPPPTPAALGPAAAGSALPQLPELPPTPGPGPAEAPAPAPG